MSEPQDWDVLARYLAGESTPEQNREIEQWMAADPENRQMVEKLRVSFSISDATDERSDLPLLWNEIANKARASESVRSHPVEFEPQIEAVQRRQHSSSGFAVGSPIFRIVAVAALLVLMAISLKTYWASPQMIEANVPVGGRSTIVLGDGTSVVLDAGSKLKYPDSFGKESRHVYLQGEAYFQVVPDKSSPFIVSADCGQVEVLGTTFNVSAWGDSGSVEVAVKEGRVKFSLVGENESNAVIVVAHQGSVLHRGGKPSSPSTIDIEKKLAWMRDEAFFENAALAEILERLHRWHGVEALSIESSLLEERLTVHLSKSSIENSVSLLAELTGSKFENVDGTYRLHPTTEAGK